MPTISTNGASLVVFLLGLFGFNVAEADIIQVISAIFTLVSFYGLLRNQWNRKDTKFFFFKKEPWEV